MKACMKGGGPVTATFATGGPVLGSRSRFMKTPDSFRTDIQRSDYDKSGKAGELAKPTGDKSLPVIKPKT